MLLAGPCHCLLIYQTISCHYCVADLDLRCISSSSCLHEAGGAGDGGGAVCGVESVSGETELGAEEQKGALAVSQPRRQVLDGQGLFSVKHRQQRQLLKRYVCVATWPCVVAVFLLLKVFFCRSTELVWSSGHR